MFRLVRFFLFTSIIAAVAVAVAVIAYRRDEVQRLIDFAEGQNVALARSFANAIWPRFPSNRDVDAPARSRDADALHEVLKSLTMGLPVLKVQLFDADGLTIYSTERHEIGVYRADNPGFKAARDGKPASKLTFRDQISTFEGKAFDRDLVETYLPVRVGDGPIEGVFELYSDVTPLVAAIEKATINLGVGFVVVFGFLYAILLLVVRVADRTIKRQYADIADKNRMLEREVVERRRTETALTAAHDELERRVEERTCKLSEEIAERRRAEDNLRKLSRAVEQSPAMTIITDVDGRIEYVNPRFTQVTGYGLDEVLGQTPRVLKSGEMAADEYELLWTTIKSGREWRGEIHNRKKNGDLFWALASISPITDQDGVVTHFLGISEDITQHKRVEEDARRHRSELAHTGRVIVMGEMATSLAHELNQPLTVISGCAQVCRHKLHASGGQVDGMLDPVEQIAEQAQRANEIIRRIRGFLRKEEHERQLIDVSHAINAIADLLRGDAREQGALIELELQDGLPLVSADLIQIQQVVLNLAHNGMEAMAGCRAGRRRLTVRTSRAGVGDVEVAVEDTGRGIPAENLARIFDPFFTTKPSGLGMGLAISRSIVESHGGRLWATSSEGAGSVFRFNVPAANGGPQ
ncbi:MAG TPA: ATP-binding protein [Sphingomicrobium sp.]|nr:ATP-binding protein [Sphingomicrobium sp.]